jgi:type II secretory pathway pseudopilin PulG
VNLLELIIALTLLAILATLSLPGARHGLDGLRVRQAREATFALATRARAVALERGGANLILDLAGSGARVEAADSVIVAAARFAECDILVAGATGTVTLTYDARGLGRMASRTVRFECGRAQAGLTFSSYGRVRRW